MTAFFYLLCLPILPQGEQPPQQRWESNRGSVVESGRYITFTSVTWIGTGIVGEDGLVRVAWMHKDLSIGFSIVATGIYRREGKDLVGAWVRGDWAGFDKKGQPVPEHCERIILIKSER